MIIKMKKMIQSKTIFQLKDLYLENNKPIIVRRGMLVGYGSKE